LPAAVLIANPPVNGTMDSVSAYRSPGFGPNWAILLLPHLEQDNLYRTINVANYLASNGIDQSWRNIRSATVKSYLCPSDTNQDQPFALNGGGWARGNYAANAGPGWLNWTQNGHSDSGGATAAGTENAGGPMGINWGATLTTLATEDGTSNTILFNEVRVGVNQNDRRGVWAMGLAASSITAAHAIGDCTTPNDTNPKSDDIENCQQIYGNDLTFRDNMGPVMRIGCSWDNAPQNWPNWQGQARSQHSNGVNVCFCDGSVRFISNDVPQTTWFRMNSRNDGATWNF
jgi:prepilin-type processing-associated H-X9-DG protein